MADSSNSSLNCTAIHDQTVLILGQVFNSVWLFISVIFLYIFACKLCFRPRIYLWLSFYTLGFMLWVLCKVLQEYVTGKFKCVITNCIGDFCLVFLSCIMLGIMLDRYLKIQGTLRGGMKDIHIGIFVSASCFGSLMIALLDGLHMGDSEKLQFNGTESFKCLPATSVSSYKAQLMFKSIFCIICIIMCLILTCLTAKKVLGTRLRKKYVIVGNVGLLSFVNILLWVMIACGLLKQALESNLSLCPTKQSTYIYPYTMPVTVIFVLVIYLFSSTHMKNAMRKSGQIRHSLSSPNQVQSSFRLV
ncbi:A5 [Alcelaphine gammaherpesvirus 1]|uniref:G-protein coupled receptor A5 n=1 Tax=Alcelaphine herpesvirus 1 (strain C500) TaxID=654901 RepID=VGA5_ALHV1|nr:A5 [Alcelaphine gammaherpesvirus 1]O36364.1 RecName: Full=G-protein coupled receptor A5 [Alcelaphine herpesvirus 1 strain C500]AAC58061.1 A5 [Alcelaphine gammaherpesvirus 1]APB09439.1 membrane protein BILF1 [Alcelaphine gammaherpesvirus 1]APB09511.1 membrane protein BILF1 [Alcelaphine gammaherpesvirus 1]